MSSLSQMNYYQENFNSIRFSRDLVARYQERERERKKTNQSARYSSFVLLLHSSSNFLKRSCKTAKERDLVHPPRRRTKGKKRKQREKRSLIVERKSTRASEVERREAKIPKRIIISGTTSRRHSGINENFRVELQLSPDDGNEQPRSKLPFQSRAKAR